MPALKPTSELRFVIKYIPVPGRDIAHGVRILQQKWVLDIWKMEALVTNPEQYDEWRDVPLVELEAPREPTAPAG